MALFTHRLNRVLIFSPRLFTWSVIPGVALPPPHLSPACPLTQDKSDGCADTASNWLSGGRSNWAHTGTAVIESEIIVLIENSSSFNLFVSDT